MSHLFKHFRLLLTVMVFLFLGFNQSSVLSAQAPKRYTSADIYEQIRKLNVLCSVLYVAAHPDDENTNFISYCANERHFETRYLSVTRGDGGQNLIGAEYEELLGMLRTQELLAARRIDGGNQSFTRANDFGYSKSPEETLRIWDKEDILSDVVWAIRRYQPDVIVNRFTHTTDRPNHGHHTASAQLSLEAFDLAGRSDVFPEQLKYVSVWQPRRLLQNTSWWWYGSREAFDKVDKSNMVSLDIGVYYPSLGKSNREIAAESRSQHRCQGMGTTPERGSSMEYFDFLKGDKPKDDLVEGINTTWSRLQGGEPIGALLKEVEKTYSYSEPSASVPKLLVAMQMIEKLPDSYWKRLKLEDIRETIAACMGLYLEAIATDYSAVPGQLVSVGIEATNRSQVPAVLKSVTFLPEQKDTAVNFALKYNTAFKFNTNTTLPLTTGLTNAYWLNEIPGEGMYEVADKSLIGLPETPRALKAVFSMFINGYAVDFTIDVLHKWEDPSKGESYRPFEVTPPVFVNLDEKSYVFTGIASRPVTVHLKAAHSDISGQLSLNCPKGWEVQPSSQPFRIAQKGQDLALTFQVTPPVQQNEGTLRAEALINGQVYDQEVVYIKYDHIPTQTVLRKAASKIVKVALEKKGEHIGYIMGAGDQIPESLTQIGYRVDLLDEKNMDTGTLRQYDAIIVGVRAYNTKEWLKFAQPVLYQYVENGGTMIVQYHTNFDLFVDSLAPITLKLSRDRVTDENSEMRFLKPEHPVLNSPNKISQEDFKGWVQERGLYFPNQWDPGFEAILSCNDPGETPKDGGLLVAPYGKGYYIYTGFSWFRELPAGVPGAYRLFANLISLGKSSQP